MKHTNNYRVESIEYDNNGIHIWFCDGTFISYGDSLYEKDKPCIEITLNTENTTLVAMDGSYNIGFHGHDDIGACLLVQDRKITYSSEAFEKCEALDTEEESYVIYRRAL